MAITGIQLAYFFEYTHHGHHMEQIVFDEEYWNDMEDKLKFFWFNFLAPTLIQPNGL